MTPAELVPRLLRLGAEPPESRGREHSSCVEDPSLGELRVRTVEVLSDGVPATLLVVRRPDAGDRPSAAPWSRDHVTDLPDRRTLERMLAHRFCDQGRPFALLFLDLDGFKKVNDTLGHVTGDRTLREVARRFVDALRDVDTVARYGGDEFVVIAEGVASLEAVEPIIARLELAVAEPIAGAERIAVSASIGVALSIDRYASPEAMLSAADRRMYQNKRTGTSRE